MNCPFCGHKEDRVVDSRESREGNLIRRRRQCLKCERRFTTYERIDEVPYMVVKKDGTRQLLVPSIKAAETMDFAAFWTAWACAARRFGALRFSLSRLELLTRELPGSLAEEIVSLVDVGLQVQRLGPPPSLRRAATVLAATRGKGVDRKPPEGGVPCKRP